MKITIAIIGMCFVITSCTTPTHKKEGDLTHLKMLLDRKYYMQYPRSIVKYSHVEPSRLFVTYHLFKATISIRLVQVEVKYYHDPVDIQRMIKSNEASLNYRKSQYSGGLSTCFEPKLVGVMNNDRNTSLVCYNGKYKYSIIMKYSPGPSSNREVDDAIKFNQNIIDSWILTCCENGESSSKHLNRLNRPPFPLDR